VRFDAETFAMLKVLLAGVWIKTLGYLTVGAGIFLAPVSKLSTAVITLGLILVAIGWILVYKALIMSRR